MINSIRTHLLLTTLLGSLVGSTPSLPAADFSGRLELKLDGALAQFRDGKFGKPAHLDVYAGCERGQWRDVWAESDEFNRGIHLGEVTEATVTSEAMRLEVKLALGSDTGGKPSASGNTFTIEGKDGATMKGTFLQPSAVTLTVTNNTLRATGGSEFLVVMTVQRGPAPEVKPAGDGSGAKVEVGRQTVLLHEGRITMTR